MIPLKNNPKVDLNDPNDYPDGRLIDNDGTGNGTAVNRQVYGDIHSNISKLMRLYNIIPNEEPDRETGSYQIIEALRALASKNDFIYPLSTNGTILNVDIKFSYMLENEYIVCLCAFNKGSETEIKGIGAGNFTITYSGDFKTNEYVRVIKTSGGVSIIRLADTLSLDAMATELGYLKKASQAEENAGAIDTKATTPLTNLVAFTKRVIGVDSVNYLAIPTGTGERNGLLSKEDKKKLDDFEEIIIGSGSVSSTGTKISQKKISFTSSLVSTGKYLITHNFGYSNYGVAGSGITNGVMKIAMETRLTNSCVLVVSDDNSRNSEDFAFMFFKL